MLPAEMKITARKKCGDGGGTCERADVSIGDLFKVIATCGSELDGKLRGAGVGKLLGVKSRSKAVGLALHKDVLGLLASEGATVAEDIAEFRKLFRGDFGEELVDEQTDVLVGASFGRAEFRGHDMRAKESRNNFERLIGG